MHRKAKIKAEEGAFDDEDASLASRAPVRIPPTHDTGRSDEEFLGRSPRFPDVSRRFRSPALSLLGVVRSSREVVGKRV